MSIVDIYGSPFKHSMSKAELKEARAAVDFAFKMARQRADELRAAVKAEDQGAITVATDTFLHSPDVRLACAIAANSRLKPRKRRTLETCLMMPASLSFDEPISEKVEVFAKRKPDGGVRAMQEFGLKHRTAQEMISRIIAIHHKPRPFQFALEGSQKAIQTIKCLANAGYVHAAHFDIKNHYGSFELEKLQDLLPLPKEVVRNAVCGRYMEHVLAPGKHGKTDLGSQKHSASAPYGSSTSCASSPQTTTLLTQARQGIPQGSGSSPKVAEFSTSRLAFKGAAAMAPNYADNFLLLAESKSALKTAKEKLVAAMGDLPGGSFNLVLKDERALSQGIQFIGHELLMKDGALQAWPTWTKQETLFYRLQSYERRLEPALMVGNVFDMNSVIDTLARMYAMLVGWESAFSACDEINEITAAHRISLQGWADSFCLDLATIQKHVTRDMKFTPSLSS